MIEMNDLEGVLVIYWLLVLKPKSTGRVQLSNEGGSIHFTQMTLHNVWMNISFDMSKNGSTEWQLEPQWWPTNLIQTIEKTTENHSTI